VFVTVPVSPEVINIQSCRHSKCSRSSNC
jgi:hypothetical protein